MPWQGQRRRPQIAKQTSKEKGLEHLHNKVILSLSAMPQMVQRVMLSTEAYGGAGRCYDVVVLQSSICTIC